MHYDNFIKRFILRKDFFKRAKNRISITKRHHLKSEIDDIADLFQLAGKKVEVVFDCGANIGFVTHKYVKAHPLARIYSFEPNPVIFEKLEAQYASNKNVKCFNKGIGSIDGKMTFHINKNSGTSSFLAPTDFHQKNLSTSNIVDKEVEIVTIQSILNKEKIDHIDVLKLDIEGFEIEAMKGIDNIAQSVSLVFAEVNLIPTYEGQPLMEDVIFFMREKGFSTVNFYGLNENQNHQAIITNLLFMSPVFKKRLIDNGHKRSFDF